MGHPTLFSQTPQGLKRLFLKLHAVLKGRSSTVLLRFSMISQIKVKNSVEGNHAEGVRGSHLSQKRRKMGHPAPSFVYGSQRPRASSLFRILAVRRLRERVRRDSAGTMVFSARREWRRVRSDQFSM
jgi:hypothetical protein